MGLGVRHDHSRRAIGCGTRWRQKKDRFARHVLTAVAAFAFAMCLPAASFAYVNPPPVHISVDPQEPQSGGSMVMERQAPRWKGQDFRWVSNLLLRIVNKSDQTLTLESYTLTVGDYGPITYDNELRAPTLDADENEIKYPELILDPQETEEFLIPRTSFPKGGDSATVRLTFAFRGFDPYVLWGPIRPMQYEIPGDAHRFPAKSEDLPQGVYWSVRNTHESKTRIEAHHNRPQIFSYDLGNMRWDRKLQQWTELTEAGTERLGVAASRKALKEEYLIYGRPVYAMAEGTVLECMRTVPENPVRVRPGNRGPPAGGNYVVVRQSTGIAHYAHLKYNTVPLHVCPVEYPYKQGPVKVRVHEGQKLGEVGWTGATGHPHTHIHLSRYEGTDDRIHTIGLPLQFAWYKTRTFIDYRPDAGGEIGFASIRPGKAAGLGSDSLIKPNPCGWDPPAKGLPAVVRGDVPWECFQEVFDEVTQAGYVPMWIEGSRYDPSALRQEREDGPAETKLNMIFRPLNVGWRAKIYDSREDFKAEYDKLIPKGFRNVHVDAFVHDGKVRYAAVYHQNSAPQPYTYVDLSLDSHKKRFDERKRDGYVPSVISVARRSVAGKVESRFTAIYEKRSVDDFKALHDIDFRLLGSALARERKNGLQPVYLDSYLLEGHPNYSVIWERAKPDDVHHERPIPGAHFKLVNNEQLQAHRMPVAITEFGVVGTFQLPAIWRRVSRPEHAIPGFFVIACPDEGRLDRDVEIQGSLHPPQPGNIVQIDFTSPAGAVRTVEARADAAGNFDADYDAYDDGNWTIQARLPAGTQVMSASNPCSVEVELPGNDDDDDGGGNKRRRGDRDGGPDVPPPGPIPED